MDELYKQILWDLDEAETVLENEVIDMPEEKASIKLSPGTWSIADCVVHLSMIELSVLNITRKVPDQSSVLHTGLTIIGREKLRTGLLDRTNKVKLPEAFESRMEQMSLQKAYDKLQTARTLTRSIIAAGKIANPELIVVHPVLGNMTKIDWLFTLAFHSMRHTEQIIEIKKYLTIE